MHDVAEVVTSASLARALREGGSLEESAEPVVVRVERRGAGQLADSFQVLLSYDQGRQGPASVFVKLPSSDEHSVATAARIGAYEREWRFYTHLLPTIDVRTPALLGVLDLDGGQPGLVLEDLSTRTRPLDQLADGSPSEVTSALAQLPGLQAPHWDDDTLGDRPWFYNRTTDHIEGLHERYAISWRRHGEDVGRGLSPAEREVVEVFGSRCVDWARGIDSPRTLVHQDLRLDNLLLGREGAWIVDWQTLAWASPAWDPAFLMGTALDPAVRRAIEREAVDAHVDRLASRGVAGWDRERAWTEHRRLSGAALLAMVPAMAFVQPTERGFAMFASLIARGARHALDLDLLEFL